MAPFSAAFVASSRTRAALAGLRSHEGGISRAQAIPITLKFRKAIAIKKMALPRFRRLVARDPGDLLRADPEARWASWHRARQAGVLSPNDARTEEGWPASTGPTSDSIEPAAMGGAKPSADGEGARIHLPHRTTKVKATRSLGSINGGRRDEPVGEAGGPS